MKVPATSSTYVPEQPKSAVEPAGATTDKHLYTILGSHLSGVIVNGVNMTACGLSEKLSVYAVWAAGTIVDGAKHGSVNVQVKVDVLTTPDDEVAAMVNV